MKLRYRQQNRQVFRCSIFKIANHGNTKDAIKVVARNYASLYSKVFDVSQFCNVDINCPYNISIRPIDVFQRQDKVIVNIDSNGKDLLSKIRCANENDKVTVEVEKCEKSSDVTVNIETPVKTSLKINGDVGNIDVGSFVGKYIEVNSVAGNITLSKTQCEKISLCTDGGNIICKDMTQAGDICLTTKKSGNITTGRLQGIHLKCSTTNGQINTGSSYCDNSIFETDFGHLNLQNVHKNVIININYEGLLNMSGFDGVLMAKINKGLIDIQLSRLNEDSLIFMKEPSTLILRLSELCQDYTEYKILAGNCVVGQEVKLNSDKNGDMLLLHPKKDIRVDSHLVVDCKNSHVLINSFSWSEMFELKNKT